MLGNCHLCTRTVVSPMNPDRTGREPNMALTNSGVLSRALECSPTCGRCSKSPVCLDLLPHRGNASSARSPRTVSSAPVCGLGRRDRWTGSASLSQRACSILRYSKDEPLTSAIRWWYER